MALAAVVLCSSGAAFAADVNPAPAPAPDDSNFFSRLYHAYVDEWGMATAPVDPNAPPGPPSRRPPPWQQSPESTPPMPFADWPQGGLDYIGEATPNAVDSPLMCEIVSNCDPSQGRSISLITRVNPFPGWGHAWTRKMTPSIPIFHNEINALGIFREGVNIASEFTMIARMMRMPVAPVMSETT